MLGGDHSAGSAAGLTGQVSLVASNLRWRAHELVILKLAAGAAAGHRVPAVNGKVTDTSSRGKPRTAVAMAPVRGSPVAASAGLR